MNGVQASWMLYFALGYTDVLILYSRKIVFSKDKIKFPAHSSRDKNEEWTENVSFLAAISMVYIYSCRICSLSCPTELFGKNFWTWMETESSQRVADEVSVSKNHYFFIMFLIRIFAISPCFCILSSMELSSTIAWAKCSRVKFKAS